VRNCLICTSGLKSDVTVVYIVAVVWRLFDFFPRWRPSAILDLWYSCMDHPQRAFDGHLMVFCISNQWHCCTSSWYLVCPRERWRSFYCDDHVCLSVCPRAYLRSHTRDLYQFFCACCLWPWLGAPPAGWRNLNGMGQFCNAFAAKGIIPYRPVGGDGSAQRGRIVICDCLVSLAHAWPECG